MPVAQEQSNPSNTNEQIVDVLQQLFGKHPGYRPVHAKGVLCTGSFGPNPAATSLSRAPHFAGPVSITVRFSNFTGLPNIADGDHNASPRGMAVRFHTGNGVDVDIVAHSVNGFPASTAEEFLGFLTALAQTAPDAPHPTPIEKFLSTRPAAAAFASAANPAPVSFGSESYYAINAFKFTNSKGEAKYARLQIHPISQERHLSNEEAATQSNDYLFEDLAEQLKQEPMRFRLVAQLPAAGDPTNDASVTWPDDRPTIELGTLSVNALVPDSKTEERKLIFDPMHLVDGIEPSDDPLIRVRSEAYAVSYRRRNAG